MTDANESDLQYYTNGLNGSTGQYIDEFWSLDDVVKQALAEGQMPHVVYKDHEKRVKAQEGLSSKTYSPPPGRDPDRLDSVGWCAVFPEDSDPAVRRNLARLLDRRREQAGALYCEYGGERGSDYNKAVGYQPGETWDQFRTRHHVELGLAMPRQMPYYVLLVGGPEEIPFSFQYEIDVQRAVGRIHFDTLGEYARYAESVVGAEEGKARLPRQAVLFGTQNPDDRSTRLAAEHLVAPLYNTILQAPDYQDSLRGWDLLRVPPSQATKRKLHALLGGPETPALLFSASHGAAFPPNAPERQHTHQGALVCQDWPGPGAWRGPLPDDFLLSAADVDDGSSLWGLVSVFFACFSAGSPRQSDFIHRQKRDPTERDLVAERAFVSPLAKRLLAHPNGGALAVVGHIERAWATSFLDSFSDNSPSVGAFEILLAGLMQGQRLGWVMEAFNLRYAEISTKLSSHLWNVSNSREVLDAERVAAMWTTAKDARNYVVIGDPAVRLAV